MLFPFLPFPRTQDSDLVHVCAAGELSVRVIDSMLGTLPKLWEFSGKTGTEPEAWQQVNLTIGVRKHRFQVSIFFWTDIISVLQLIALMMRSDSQI